MLASRRVWRLGSRLVALALPGCAAVLGIEDGTTQGACATTDECAPGYSCLLGSCRAGCRADADCGSNATCLDLGGPSACLPTDATCGGAAECPDGTACEAERCRNLCDTTADCPGGQECDRGYCFSAEGGVGGSGGMGGRGGSSGNGGSGGGVSGDAGMAGDTGSGGSAGKGGTTGEPSCGDGTRNTGEACDDGNDEPADGCTDCERDAGFDCQGNAPTVCTPICGDGQVVGREARAGGCDDNDEQGGDGCSALCEVEDGWSCTGAPSRCTEGCGDGVLDDGEACDDGNEEDGDGCAACALEDGFVCDVTRRPSRCTDIDECEEDAPCDVNADCTNEPGGYRCECRAGWQGSGDTCTDVNECGNGTCSPVAICQNSVGSFSCECPLAYAGDGIVCQDARIPSWPVPVGGAFDYELTTGVVHDNITGLDWQRGTDGPYSRDAAASHCENLELGGFSDWRLPTRVELATIFLTNAGGGAPLIDRTAFLDTAGYYWTASSPPGMNGAMGWSFSFGSVQSDPTEVENTLNARCVRSTPTGAAPVRFTFISASLVRDNETGLVWTRDVGVTSTVGIASGACQDLVSGDYSDFRLPTLAELLTIADESVASGTYHYTDFFVAPSSDGSYWTDETYSMRAVVLDLDEGDIGTMPASTDSLRRRCVQAP